MERDSTKGLQGPLYWKYQGETLVETPQETGRRLAWAGNNKFPVNPLAICSQNELDSSQIYFWRCGK